MWGAYKADSRIALSNSVKVRAALRLSIKPEQIFKSYLDTHPTDSGDITQNRTAARAWVMLNVITNRDPIRAVIIKLYADGYVMGELAASEAILQLKRKRKISKADAYTDWNNWTPGNKSTALLLRPRGAFQSLLDQAGIVSETIARAGYDRIGTALADSIEAGLSPSNAAKVIAEKIGDPARALTIAITEQNRAMSAASLNTYRDAEIEQCEWDAVDPCEICAPNDGQVVNLGEAFESGDTQPPAHPNCRCALLPVIAGLVDDASLGQDYLDSLSYD